MDKLTEGEIMALVNKHFWDRFTALDELLAQNVLTNKQQTKLLERILKIPPEIPPIPPAPPAPPFDGRLDEIVKLLEDLRDAEKYKREQREDIIYLTYPATGGSKTLPVGITQLDMYEGRVNLADGTHEDMSTALKRFERIHAHSVYVETDKEMKVRIEETGGWHTVDAEDFFLSTFVTFREFYIETTEAAQIKFWACTNPEAILKKAKSLSFGTGVKGIKTTVFDAVSIGAAGVETAPTTGIDTSDYSKLTIYIYNTQAATLDIEVSLDGGTTWYNLEAGKTISANTLYKALIEYGMPLVRLEVTQGATAGTLYGWIYGKY